MNKLVKKLALASTCVALLSGATGALVENNPVHAAKSPSWIKYTRKFYRVEIKKKTQVYKVIPGKYAALNRYKKAYVLNPGDTVAIRARGVNWGWTINDYKHCSFRAVDDLSWFHTINYDYYPATWFDDDSDDNLFYKLTDKQFKPLKKILNTYYKNPKLLAKKSNAYFKKHHLKPIDFSK